MEKHTCKVCEEVARRKAAARTKAPQLLEICDCAGYKQFILSGPAPTTRHDVDLLCGDLKRRLGLSKTPGPKAKDITWMDIAQAYEKIPGAGLLRLADELGVSTRKVQEALKRVGETFTSFKSEFLKQRRRNKSRITPRFKPRMF
jgi:hypothetical protein